MEREIVTREDTSKSDNFRLKAAFYLFFLPPLIAINIAIGIAVADVKIETIRVGTDNLIGIEYDTYQNGTCHIGVHPTGGNHDLHGVCSTGNGPYITILPGIRP